MTTSIIGHRYGIEDGNICHIGILAGIKKSMVDPKFDLVYLDKCKGYIIGFANELIIIN